MKWALFIGAVLVAYGLGRSLRRSPRWQLHLWVLAGLLPFIPQPGMGIIFDREFPGDSHGIEVALLDILAITLLAATGGVAHRKVPYRALLVAYLLAALLSVTQAVEPLPAFFYVWKLLRMLLLFVVLVRAAELSNLVAPAVLRGMMLGTLFQLALVLWQRYGLGMHQVTGSFGHQNSLGVAMNLVVMVPVAVLLGRQVTWLTIAAPIAGLVTVVLTLSRGALLFSALGVTLIFLLSLTRGPRLRKLVYAGLGLAVAAVVLFKAGPRIIERFETAPAESMQVREQFKEAASMMLDAHPLGVGANHFSWTMKNRGYGTRAAIDSYNQTAIVHNLYWLTAAEMGYFGLLSLLALLLIPATTAFWHGLVTKGDVRADVLLGMSVGLLMCYVHGTVEWVWRTTEVSYLFWMLLALCSCLVRELKDAAAAQLDPAEHTSA